MESPAKDMTVTSGGAPTRAGVSCAAIVRKLCFPMPSRQENQWRKARGASHKYYGAYLSQKGDPFDLTEIDLLYVKNFKGGAATINEEFESLKSKLNDYSRKLRAINLRFGKKSLRDLNDKELTELKEQATAFVQGNASTHIDGFGPSFSSALLNFHFPELLPILDKRALNGAGLLQGDDHHGKNQVGELGAKYSEEIDFFYRKLREQAELTIEQLDLELFKKPFPKSDEP
jgi:hypothetical protein